MQHELDSFLSMAGRHPTAALVLIALVAFAESLAIVGTVVPAAIVMFGAGALVGQGTLPFAWTLGAAVAGAVAGDALSYELGRHQQDRVRAWPLFRRYADHLGKEEELIARHGAVSVLIARFTGVVRAFVPLLAGFARMPAGRFYATNVTSALLWAPAHILPGVAFGASLHLAEQVSGRLAALMLLLAALVWAATWLARATIRVAVPVTRVLRAHAIRAAGNRTAWWARLVRLLLDPERPGSQALLAAFVLLLGSMWLFLGIVEDIVEGDPLVMVDQAVFTFLQQLRTAPMDRVMVGITEMGSVGVLLPLVVVVAAWLVARRCWRTAGYWIATVASSELVVKVLKLTLGRNRPLSLYQGVERYSFPSGHATGTAVVLATLAFLLTRGQSLRWRITVGASVAVYAALVGFSRLYVGAHWLSDVVGGFSFGLAAVVLAAMVYTHHPVREPIQPKRLAIVAGATILVAGSLWGWRRAPGDMAIYAAQIRPSTTTIERWTDGGFSMLPAHRRDIAGEHKERFTVQVACSESALREGLRRAGWMDAPGLDFAPVLQAIAPRPAIRELPLLPRYDGGRASSINLIQVPAPTPDARYVLRLWKSEWELAGSVPIWYGGFDHEVLVRPAYSFLRRQPRSAEEFAPGLQSAGWHRMGAAAARRDEMPQLWICQR